MEYKTWHEIDDLLLYGTKQMIFNNSLYPYSFVLHTSNTYCNQYYATNEQGFECVKRSTINVKSFSLIGIQRR